MRDIKRGIQLSAAAAIMLMPLSAYAEYIKWEASVHLRDLGEVIGHHWTPSILHDEEFVMTFYFDTSSTWGSPDGSYPITVPAHSGSVSISSPHTANIVSLPNAGLHDSGSPFVGERFFWDAAIAVNGQTYDFWWIGDYNFVDPLPAPGDTVELGQLPEQRYSVLDAGLGADDFYFSRGSVTVSVVDEIGTAPEVPLPLSLPLLASGIATIGWLSRRRANHR